MKNLMKIAVIGCLLAALLCSCQNDDGGGGQSNNPGNENGNGNTTGFPAAKGKMTINGLGSFNDKYVYVSGLAGSSNVLVGLTDITGYPSDVTYKLAKISGGKAEVPLYMANASASTYSDSFIAYSGNDTITSVSIIIINESSLKASNASSAIMSNLGMKTITTGTFTNGNMTIDWGSGGNGTSNVWTTVTNSTFGTDSILAIAYGNGKFVAGGDGGKMAYSADGITWTAVSDSAFASDNFIHAIAWGNNKFVAGGTNGKMAYSADGITWTAVKPISGSATKFINAITWGNNKFVVAVGDYGGMAYSFDGITWTAVTNITFIHGSITAIAWGNDKFVAVGSSQMAYSSDGITWTAVSDSVFADDWINAIAWGNNKFVTRMIFYSGMAYSADGITWTAVSDSAFAYDRISAIAWGNNKFVAVGDSGRMAYWSGNVE
jgi:hypothetical protein